MFKKILSVCALVMGIAGGAHAATFNAQFDASPTRGGSTLPASGIIDLVLTDLIGGGVQFTVTALDANEGIGSFFIGGAANGDFTGPAGVFNASSGNAYVQDLGVNGAVFTTDGLSIFSPASLTFTSTNPLLTTADFSSSVIGFISTTISSPDSLGSLYGGTFVPATAPVPLPAGGALLVSGVFGFAVLRRRQSRKAH